EPVQLEPRRMVHYADVPVNAIYISFHVPAKNDQGYYETDLIGDLLSRGNSSRLYKCLIKERKLFTDINASLTGSSDPGLLIIDGRPSEGVTIEEAEAAI